MSKITKATMALFATVAAISVSIKGEVQDIFENTNLGDTKLTVDQANKYLGLGLVAEIQKPAGAPEGDTQPVEGLDAAKAEIKELKDKLKAQTEAREKAEADVTMLTKKRDEAVATEKEANALAGKAGETIKGLEAEIASLKDAASKAAKKT